MKCYECGSDHAVLDTRDVPYTYRGKEAVIPNVTAEFCPECENFLATPDEAQRYGEQIAAFQRAVNAELVDPEWIAAVRDGLGMTQQKAAEVFGGGINAFSRYERGVAVPPKSLILLLGVLERHPELIAELTDGVLRQMGKPRR